MNNTINGRTPEEIKRGLECFECDGCAYSRKNNDGQARCSDVEIDALAYIQQLEAGINQHLERERDELLQKNQQLERERNAAVEELKVYKFCTACKHDKDDLDANKNSPCFGCHSKSNWEWRGPQEVDN